MRVCQLPHTRAPSVDTEELSQQRAMAQMHADARTGMHNVPQSFGGTCTYLGSLHQFVLPISLFFMREVFLPPFPRENKL